MARLFGSKDGPNVQRHYHKHKTEYWDRPTLADQLLDYLEGSTIAYQDLRDWAVSQGYSTNSFYAAISALREQGTVVQDDGVVSASSGGYTGGDWI